MLQLKLGEIQDLYLCRTRVVHPSSNGFCLFLDSCKSSNCQKWQPLESSENNSTSKSRCSRMHRTVCPAFSPQNCFTSKTNSTDEVFIYFAEQNLGRSNTCVLDYSGSEIISVCANVTYTKLVPTFAEIILLQG